MAYSLVELTLVIAWSFLASASVYFLLGKLSFLVTPPLFSDTFIIADPPWDWLGQITLTSSTLFRAFLERDASHVTSSRK